MSAVKSKLGEFDFFAAISHNTTNKYKKRQRPDPFQKATANPPDNSLPAKKKPKKDRNSKNFKALQSHTTATQPQPTTSTSTIQPISKQLDVHLSPPRVPELTALPATPRPLPEHTQLPISPRTNATQPEIATTSPLPSELKKLKRDVPRTRAQRKREPAGAKNPENNQELSVEDKFVDDYPINKTKCLKNSLQSSDCVEESERDSGVESRTQGCDDSDSDIIEIGASRLTNDEIFLKVYEKVMDDEVDILLLNRAQSWSNLVYGEITHDLISEMITALRRPPYNVKFDSTDTFTDLGSGIGQVTLQVAATTRCRKSNGVELEPYRGMIADKFQKELRYTFKRIASLQPPNTPSHTAIKLGKSHLHKGDFLGRKGMAMIRKSTIIFTNNYIFGAKLNHQLVEIFKNAENCKHGTIIVSSKKFADGGPINSRNLNSFDAVVDVGELCSGHVSWTDRRHRLYAHRINYSKLEDYMRSGGK